MKDHTKWWDKYDNHNSVLIDDFRESRMKFTNLLNLLDRYEYRCEIKGGFRQLRSKNIIITSDRHPEDIYRKTNENINQLLRRIDVIYNLDDPIKLARAETLGNTIPTSV
jgi:hypothetical protein